MTATGKLLGKSGPLIIMFLALLPVLFWLPFSDFSSPSKIWLSTGQFAGLVGFSLYALNIILSARFRFTENLFVGLNRVYIFHHLVGIVAFILMLYHPLGIAFSYLYISLSAAAGILIPSLSNVPVLFGILAQVTTEVLLVLTLYVRLEYNFWKRTHQFLGGALFLASLHVVLIGSTLDQSLPLKLYLYALTAVSLSCFTYRTLLGRILVKKRAYIVEKATALTQDIQEIVLKPESGKPMIFHPGQFVFVEPQARGVPKESHPFSIVSARNSDRLVFASKSVGGFTETLKLITPGTRFLVEGPFGRFSYDYFPNPHQLWIAGGIGVTPFISMARSLKPDPRSKIDLYYLVKEESEAVYVRELKQISQDVPNFHFVLHDSSKKGRLTVDTLSKDLPDLVQKEIFLCGPPAMMSAHKKQFREMKISSFRIHSEEFSLN